MSTPNDKMRCLYEVRFPYFKTIKALCFSWPDGHPTVLFTRDEHGEYVARIQNVELKVHSLGFAITAWSEDIIEDPCDDNQRCRDGNDIKDCDCPYLVRACVETSSSRGSVYSAPWPTWDEHCTDIRNMLRKHYRDYNPAALVFADATWDFRK
jgi:hypothetical protein